MKKVFLLLVTLIFTLSMIAFGVVGCKGETTEETTEEAVEETAEEAAEETAEEAAEEEAVEEEPLVIGYLVKNLAVQWCQDMEAAMIELGKEYNFELITANAEANPEKQLDQLDTFIAQGIDGIVNLVADPGIAPAIVNKCNENGIPIVGESIILTDEEGNLIAPCVQLSAVECGSMCSQWIYDNYKSLGFDFGDLSKVGFVTISNSTQPNNEWRADGAQDKFVELFPEIPESNIFRADVAGESDRYQEGAYNQIAAIISANPNIETWVMVGTLEEYAQGAVRAIEANNLEDSTILTSIGGEIAVKEWDSGLVKCWYAASYYEAMDCASLAIDGLLKMIRENVAPEDLFPEWKEEGAKYAAAKFSGRMITADNYKEFVSE